MGSWGVGMPGAVKLDLYGDQLFNVFGGCPYLVGSALTMTQWRDVDVRVILSDEDFVAMFPGLHPGDEHRCAKWVAMCLAFSALGKEMTGLPIDFQIQQQSSANEMFKGTRSAIGIVEHRITKKAEE